MTVLNQMCRYVHITQAWSPHFPVWRTQCGEFCMLMCLGFLSACLGEMAHCHISPNTQDKDCMVTCSVHTYQTQRRLWNTNVMQTCWKNRRLKGIMGKFPLSYFSQSKPCGEDWLSRRSNVLISWLAPRISEWTYLLAIKKIYLSETSPLGTCLIPRII